MNKCKHFCLKNVTLTMPIMMSVLTVDYHSQDHLPTTAVTSRTTTLCKSYNHILIPKFHCMAMKHFLAKSSMPQLMHWLHYKFQQQLKHKAKELGVCVSECWELLTTMTCSKCLWVKE